MIQDLKETIFLTSEYYGQTLRAEVLLMYVDDFSDYNPARVIEAYKIYRKNPKNTRAPLPSQIISILNPEINDDAQAVSIAAKVIEAVSKFGWCNSQDAKNYIGDIGWMAVTAFGEWQHVCENLGHKIQLSTFNAQIRDISKAEVQKSKFKIITTGPQITHQEKTNLDFSNLASGLVKDLKLVGNK